MILIYFTLILVLIGSHLKIYPMNELQFLSHFFHQTCLNQVPSSENAQMALSALVCGENFSDRNQSRLYAATGLIHLFVVSGSHLILIQIFIEFISSRLLNLKSKWFILSVLFMYSAVCLFNPPVIRSFIFLSLMLYLRHNHSYWPRSFILLISGLFCLFLNFDFINSLSFQMSWLAALTLEIHRQKFKNTNSIFRQIIFYFIFSSSFLALGFPQFSIVIVCIVLTPVLEYILFPLAFVTVIFHVFEPLFSFIILCLNVVLHALNFESTSTQVSVNQLITVNWIIIVMCHFWIHKGKLKS